MRLAGAIDPAAKYRNREILCHPLAWAPGPSFSSHAGRLTPFAIGAIIAAMRTEARFSVIIPVFNKEAVLARAVESALGQRGVDVEVICVDDGSTDASRKRLGTWGNRIQVIEQPNRGPSAARNRGVAAARYEWVAFLDADDTWDPHYLEAVARLRTARPAIAYALASYRRISREQTVIIRLGDRDLPWDAPEAPRATRHAAAALAPGIASGAIACSTDLFREVGRFDESLPRWEIADLVFRMLCARGEAGVVEEPLVTIHHDPANSQADREARNVKAHARLAASLLTAASGVTRPEGGELRAEAAQVALRSARWLLREGMRPAAKDLIRRLPPESPAPQRFATRVAATLPAALVRCLFPGGSRRKAP